MPGAHTQEGEGRNASQMCGAVSNVDPNPLNQRAVHMSGKRSGHTQI